MHDILLCFSSGACLYSIPERSLMAPAKYIKEHEITFWFSVPSVVSFMNSFKMLKENSFPAIRCSLFCGEALTVENAVAWQKAAPNSLVENIYGPTEATIAFTRYKWEKGLGSSEFEKGYVPIGEAFKGLTTEVVDENGDVCALGQTGELLLGGDQLSPGYWHDAYKTREIFIERSEQGVRSRWYKTGDLVKKSKFGLVFLGRLDSQVKINGHRVELGEIENALRKEADTSFAVAITLPLNSDNATKVVAFVAQSQKNEMQIKDRLKLSLAPYMVPQEIHFLDSFPLNANGKIDRKEIAKRLET